MKILLGIGTLAVIVFGAWYALNTYIYQEKQAELVLLEDNEYFGHITAVTDNATAIDFTEAEPGVEQHSENVRLALAPEVRIFLLTGKTGRDALLEVSPQEFGNRVEGLDPKWRKAFYHLVYTDGAVKNILELSLDTPAEFGSRDRNSAPASSPQ